MRDVVTVSGKRTAIGAYGGILKDTLVVDLGSTVHKETLQAVVLHPVASKQCIKFAPDKIRDV